MSSASSQLSQAILLFQQGKLREAEAACRAALSSNPDDVDALNLMGILAQRGGDLPRAIEVLSRAINIAPDVAKLYLNRGEAFRASNAFDRAVSDYRKAIELDPNYATAYYNLGIALRAQEKLAEAIAAYRAAVGIKPDYVKAHYNLANTLRTQLDFAAAEQAYRDAIRFDPNHAEAWNNLGEMLAEQMRIDEAFDAFSRAIELKPDHAGAHFNRSFIRLLRGEYDLAWPEHEWRWKRVGSEPPAVTLGRPMWDGSDLAGKTILLHAEQGMGDTIQFVRYATLVARERNPARVIVACQLALVSLIATVPGVDEVIAFDHPIPPFDEHAAIMSLPGIFRTTLQTIPAEIPYLFPDPARVERWHAKLAPMRKQLSVGLAWAGNPVQANDRNRSANLERLAPSLAGLANVRFFSLQKGAGREQLARVQNVIDVVDVSEDLDDYSDTAAAIANLDVVVTVCTSVAHVAGALGKPAITTLCFNADWRWLTERKDSPWYPTMKLVRQTKQGDWEGVARRVREALAERMSR